jgi:hypothetical protein
LSKEALAKSFDIVDIKSTGLVATKK